ncbi:MAG: aspartate aminotransferase family protein [Archaeoglobales archaeon]|nr:aspartate aminotransferase family protein [Archaeoglobales archaeon]
MKRLPAFGDPGILKKLEKIAEKDLDPQSGKLFGHVYNARLFDLLEVARKAYLMFMDKTMLDFTIYPSILAMENEIVAMTASLLGGDENVAGNFTYGGTESIILAVKAAREKFRREKDGVPEIVLPLTAHPAFIKAAAYLGLKVVRTRIDEKFRADPDSIAEAINEKTAIVVCSAPNYPFGCVDDVKSVAEVTEGKVWLHVDACMGGFILPFLKRLGEKITDFDFSIDGVFSISADLHKYGYAPRGASVILYRNPELRRGHIFVNASWPGYPMVNTAVLSTRSAGTLAASYAVMHYLGEEGYLKLSEKVLRARKRIERYLNDMGFEVLGIPEAGIISFTSSKVNVFKLAKLMAERMWYIQVQPGSKKLGFPKSIHLTVNPYHDEVIDQFLKDLGECSERAGKPTEIDESRVLELISSLKAERGRLPDLEFVNDLIHAMDPDFVEEMLLNFVNDYIFR